MRISGTESSSVILSQRSLKYENDAKKSQNKVIEVYNRQFELYN